MTQLGERGRQGEKTKEKGGGLITTIPEVMRDSFSATLAVYKMSLLPREGSEK